MNVEKLRSLNDYQSLVNNRSHELSVLKNHERELTDSFFDTGEFYTSGFSWPAQQNSTFLVDDLYGSEDRINFRERLICQRTRLNNRTRAALHIFSTLLTPQPNDSIYVTEQLTPLYRWLKSSYADVQGSEYLSNLEWLKLLKLKLRSFPEKLIHQDLTALTLKGETIGHVLSFDCFEHISDYLSAFKEVFRVLKPGGHFMFSVPFDLNRSKNLIRATLEEDGVVHHVEPEYHGDPVSKQGILSFYTFGWEVLDELKSVGFKDAYGAVYWSIEMAYLGGPQIMICAEK